MPFSLEKLLGGLTKGARRGEELLFAGYYPKEFAAKEQERAAMERLMAELGARETMQTERLGAERSLRESLFGQEAALRRELAGERRGHEEEQARLRTLDSYALKVLGDPWSTEFGRETAFKHLVSRGFEAPLLTQMFEGKAPTGIPPEAPRMEPLAGEMPTEPTAIPTEAPPVPTGVPRVTVYMPEWAKQATAIADARGMGKEQKNRLIRAVAERQKEKLLSKTLQGIVVRNGVEYPIWEDTGVDIKHPLGEVIAYQETATGAYLINMATGKIVKTVMEYPGKEGAGGKLRKSMTTPYGDRVKGANEWVRKLTGNQKFDLEDVKGEGKNTFSHWFGGKWVPWGKSEKNKWMVPETIKDPVTGKDTTTYTDIGEIVKRGLENMYGIKIDVHFDPAATVGGQYTVIFREDLVPELSPMEAHRTSAGAGQPVPTKHELTEQIRSIPVGKAFKLQGKVYVRTATGAEAYNERKHGPIRGVK